MHFFLPNTEATTRFGQLLASPLSTATPPVPVFFHGDLGMGKTTLISALVDALPGGEHAEASSPSFTLCNMYPTTPPVAHFDLYRQKNGLSDESLLDFLETERHVVLVEWAERMATNDFPPVRLECTITPEGQGRKATLTAYGDTAHAIATSMESMWR